MAAAAQQKWKPYNFDEAKVAPYTEPDPLVFNDGKRVKNASDWKKRREEILRVYETEVYGRTPRKKVGTAFRAGAAETALEGKALRKQVTILFNGKEDGPKASLLIYTPAAAKGPVPAFLGLNFAGNHTVSADSGIALGKVWIRGKESDATDAQRGSSVQQWQVEKILAHGFGLATIYYGDIEPDFDGGISRGVRPLFFKAGQTAPEPDEWGAIGAWAWGLSRAVDYLEADKSVDAKRIALMGHSRMGKTAMWAAAQDPRFAIVISNESGKGGASLFRRTYGETIEHLNVAFPHWFCGNFKKYNDQPEQLPVDQPELAALIAPRPLYIASAEEDRGSDPKGEFLSGVAVGPVYELLGKQGLGTSEMPGLHQPVMHTVGYHIRAGKHDVTEYDWEQYVGFAEKSWR